MAKMHEQLTSYCDGSAENKLIMEVRSELGYFNLIESEIKAKSK